MSAPPSKKLKLADSKAVGVTPTTKSASAGSSLFGSILGQINAKQVQRPEVRPMPVVLLIGAAGCGKGTQAQFLVDYFKFRHVSCGDLYRKIQNSDGSRLHKELQGMQGKEEYNQRVQALHIILRKEFKNAIEDEKVAGLVIDGCRRSDQASNIHRALRAEGLSLTVSIHLEVSTEIAAARLFSRLVHPASGRMYNTITNPPREPGKDDVTGEPLEIRENDTDFHTFRIRMETWEDNADAVFNFLKGVSQVPDPIDANRVPGQIFSELSAKLYGNLKGIPISKLTYSPAVQPALPASDSPHAPRFLEFHDPLEEEEEEDEDELLMEEEGGEGGASEPRVLIAVLSDGPTVQHILHCRELIRRQAHLGKYPEEQLTFESLSSLKPEIVSATDDPRQMDLIAAHNHLVSLVVDPAVLQRTQEAAASDAPQSAEQQEDEADARRDAAQVMFIDPSVHSPVVAAAGGAETEMKDDGDNPVPPRTLQDVLPYLDRKAGLIWDTSLLRADNQMKFRAEIFLSDQIAAQSVVRVPVTSACGLKRRSLRILCVTLPPLATAIPIPVLDVQRRPVIRLCHRRTRAFRTMTDTDAKNVLQKRKRDRFGRVEERDPPGKWVSVKNNYNQQKYFLHTGSKKTLPTVLPKKWQEEGWMVAVNKTGEKLYWYNHKTRKSIWIVPEFPMSPPDVDQDLSYGFRRPMQWRSNCDLHLHSTCSDGTLTPEQLMLRAKENGVTTLALTDHDTTSGVLEAMQIGHRLGIHVIAGIEISSEDKDGSVHVLGYWSNADRVLNDKAFQDTLRDMVDQRLERAKLMISKLADLGIHIELSKVQELADGVIGRPHIAEALKAAGYVDEIEDAFRKYLRYGRPCYVESTQTLPPEQAVAMIKNLGGLAVFAHPWCYRGNVHNVVQKMVEAGLDGMEVFKYPDNMNRWKRMCATHDLVMTGGSDFHNRIKEAGIIERQPGELPLPPEHVNIFMERLERVEQEYVEKQERLRKLRSTRAHLEAIKSTVSSAAPSLDPDDVKSEPVKTEQA